jgi:hypothetical protein
MCSKTKSINYYAKPCNTETAATTVGVDWAPYNGNPIPSGAEAMAKDYKPFADDAPNSNHNDPLSGHPESNWGLL